MMKFLSVLAALLLLGPAGGGAGAEAAGVDSLYEVATITTGKGEANRAVAFGRLLAAVLVKVSGDQRLATDPAVATLALDAASFVDTFAYHDRMAGIPVHDEQGTYDRPYDLTADFNAQKVDALLSSLGRKPWPLPRPRLVLFVGTRNGTTVFSPSSDGERDPGMRGALAAAAEQAGLHAAFASQAALAKTGARFATLPFADLPGLDAAAKADGGDVAVAGTLDFSEPAASWIVAWRMQWRGKTYEWRISGVSFDDAYRKAVAGAAQVLSGHGQPETR